MATLDEAKAEFDRAVQSGEITRISAAAQVWQAVAQAEKAESEIIRVPRRSDALRFWIPIASTLISSGALVIALVFQVYQFGRTNGLARLQDERAEKNLQLQLDQFKVTTQQSRQAAEDADFRSALEKIASRLPEANTFIGFSLMKPFLQSPKYGRLSREITVSIMSHAIELESFKNVLRDMVAATTWDNFDDLLTINRNLALFGREDNDRIASQRQSVEQVKREIEQLEATTKPSTAPGPVAVATTLSALERKKTVLASETQALKQREDAHAMMDEAAAILSREIVAFLRSRKRPPGASFDFHGTRFYRADFSNFDFGDADITDTFFDTCKFEGANLSRVPATSNSWRNTAWWKAGAINQSMFLDLYTAVTFEDGTNYADETSQSDYDTQIKRLKAAFPATKPATSEQHVP